MELDREAILKLIPHRPPFLFVDRILSLEENRRIVGIREVRADEWFFPGHFPGAPLMPGVLIVEAIAQTAACLTALNPTYAGRIAYFAAIDAVRFRRPVLPGDVLVMEAEVLWLRGRHGRFAGKATVGGELVAEGEFAFAVTDATDDARRRPIQTPGARHGE
jgi:3-hydroxyacyl-[acyl-carrier-protein] dehydratase